MNGNCGVHNKYRHREGVANAIGQKEPERCVGLQIKGNAIEDKWAT